MTLKENLATITKQVINFANLFASFFPQQRNMFSHDDVHHLRTSCAKSSHRKWPADKNSTQESAPHSWREQLWRRCISRRKLSRVARETTLLNLFLPGEHALCMKNCLFCRASREKKIRPKFSSRCKNLLLSVRSNTIVPKSFVMFAGASFPPREIIVCEEIRGERFSPGPQIGSKWENPGS